MYTPNLSLIDYGIFVHIIFLISIFDIYFKSPVVKDVVPYEPIHEPTSNRLILFVVDGLRAESFVNHTTMPYLRYIANSEGRWGISHTRVPTESRPGHVAIIAGFYEDPSAVTQGWKDNPVDFDSVFNRTKYTWSWGAYDIVDIFTKGTVDGHIYVTKFDPYDKAFCADKSNMLLDEWVFQHVQKFFNTAETDAFLNKKLHTNKIVLFLHLLGTDTSGHTDKPGTQNFLRTVEHVDENIKDIEEMIRNFYKNDGKTTFLMTSDHGMTNWGSHGTGDDHETQTPYVLWGAGVQQVKHLTNDKETKNMSSEHRYDIEQADLAPLMSTFLSIPVPVNSIGKLPVDLLNMTLPNRAKAMYSNSKQLLSQYNKKKQDVEDHVINILYKPYNPLNSEKIEEITTFSEKLLNENQYEELILFSEEVMNLSLAGLNYYHNYYQKPLLIATTLSFLGWIVCLFNILLDDNVCALIEIYKLKCAKPKENYTLKCFTKFVTGSLYIVTIGLIYVQNLPYLYYLFFLTPIILWTNALKYFDIWIYTLTLIRMYRRVFDTIIEICCYTLGCLAMGLSLTHRWMLSIPLIGMGFWPCFSSSRNLIPKPLHACWMIGCMLLSIFSFMPVVGRAVYIELVLLAGSIWMLAMMMFTFLWKDSRTNRRDIIITLTQSIIMGLSLYIIFIQARRYEQRFALLGFLQTLCWIILVVMLLLPFGHTRRMSSRLLGVNTSIVNIYLLLSVSHEALFIVVLIFNITCWMIIEFKFLNLNNVKLTDYTFSKDSEELDTIILPVYRTLTSNDFRRAFFFTLYIILAFFGTGNIASLNSFEIRWVICFTTSYQPFIITGLVFLKTLMPFLCVGCTFKAVQHITKATSEYLITIVLIYSNIMGTQLLYYVKNTGSWLEIGTSISQFVIVQIITLFIVGINIFSKIWTEEDIYSFAFKIFGRRKKNA
ncbi:GPI ethanolamine phosphate transferase 1 [Papilio machaon]|uniref:GPI ethanolamine phosphate transferase 1 n=1 Tax=Papilio machaon TaxID=76193 RepID=UPI001E663C9B|nr:GPI ethanolamine phosphate transferase 1 [Papilio machaon]